MTLSFKELWWNLLKLPRAVVVFNLIQLPHFYNWESEIGGIDFGGWFPLCIVVKRVLLGKKTQRHQQENRFRYYIS